MTMQAEASSGVIGMTDPDRLRAEYPDIISSEQLRLILRVSKRRCVWLMQNYIPHTDNGCKTRRYTIRLEDVIAFLLDFESSPESYEAPVGQFNSKPFIMPKPLMVVRLRNVSS